ncbi:hypothetical protein ACP3V3_17930, partial [Vibrio sp. PNB22_3_1]
GLRITDYGLRITDYGLRITDYGLRIIVCLPFSRVKLFCIRLAQRSVFGIQTIKKRHLLRDGVFHYV